MMPEDTQIEVPPLAATRADGLYWRILPGAGATDLAAVTAVLPRPSPSGGRRMAIRPSY